MNEIITVDATRQTVSGRELHRYLEIKYDFKRWVDVNFSQFVENRDYFATHMNVKGNQYGGDREILDYDVTLDMAKHLCLMSHSVKGKECRTYLIDLERAWNTPELIMARAIKLAEQRLEEAQAVNRKLIADNERMKPKEIFADAVAATGDLILIRDLAKLLNQNGIDTGEKRLYNQLRDMGYICKTSKLPTQRAMDMGLFKIVENTVETDERRFLTMTTKVTPKGQIFFLNKFKEAANA